MADEVVIVFFKGADSVHEVRLPALEAILAVRKHPHEYSLTGAFVDPPPGFVAATGPAGGLAPLRGASINFAHPMAGATD